jgi:hypothetical protein
MITSVAPRSTACLCRVSPNGISIIQSAEAPWHETSRQTRKVASAPIGSSGTCPQELHRRSKINNRNFPSASHLK